MAKLRSPLIITVVGVGLGCASDTAPRPAPASIRILQADPFLIDEADTERLTADVFDSTGVLINAQVRIAWQAPIPVSYKSIKRVCRRRASLAS